MAESIAFTSLALPEHTLELAYEADNVFTGLHVLADHEQQVPVVVKLGHDCLQIASVRQPLYKASLQPSQDKADQSRSGRSKISPLA